MDSSTQQIGFGFLSPEVASHTFPEYMGAWNSLQWHHGEIRTQDGRVLDAKVRLSDSQRHSVVAVIDGEQIEIDNTIQGDWIFRGNLVADVISALAIGQNPMLFIEIEDNHRALLRAEKKASRRLVREVSRQLRIERVQAELAGGAK